MQWCPAMIFKDPAFGADQRLRFLEGVHLQDGESLRVESRTISNRPGGGSDYTEILGVYKICKDGSKVPVKWEYDL